MYWSLLWAAWEWKRTEWRWDHLHTSYNFIIIIFSFISSLIKFLRFLWESVVTSSWRESISACSITWSKVKQHQQHPATNTSTGKKKSHTRTLWHALTKTEEKQKHTNTAPFACHHSYKGEFKRTNLPLRRYDPSTRCPSQWIKTLTTWAFKEGIENEDTDADTRALTIASPKNQSLKNLTQTRP